MKVAHLKVLYNSKDISEDISKDLISFELNDNKGDQADDISITLDNSSLKWINEWLPTLGSSLSISLLIDYDADKKEVEFGAFNIDEISIQVNPNIVTIKAVTALIEGPFKNQIREKKYANISIKALVSLIGKENGFSVEYKAGLHHIIKFVHKNKISDATFLYRELKTLGLIFKVNNKRITVYKDFVAGDVVPIKNYSSLSLRQTSFDVYSEVWLRCRNPKKGKKDSIDYKYEDPKVKTGKVLIVSKTAESIQEAELIAKAELRRKNMQAVTGTISIIGLGDIYSGQKIKLDDIGSYSGEYLLNKVTHSLSRSGYINNLEFTLC